MRPDHPSGRVPHVGPSCELKVPSQAAHEAKNDDVIKVDGATIRAEGDGLSLVNVYIHDNQDGILSAPNPKSDIVIESSEFAHNGTTSGSTHGIYVGQVRNFVLRASYFHDTVTGHHVKTRALNNHILYNRIMDYPESTASYSIHVLNGGRN